MVNATPEMKTARAAFAEAANVYCEYALTPDEIDHEWRRSDTYAMLAAREKDGK